MHKSKLVHRIVSGTVISLAFVVVGCATNAAHRAEDVVKLRAQDRVNLLKSKDFSKAYQYLSPSYRALNTEENYRSSFGGGAEWVEPTVTRVECADAERCIAEVKLGVLVVARGFGGKPLPTTLREIWVYENGQWWFQQNSNN